MFKASLTRQEGAQAKYAVGTLHLVISYGTQPELFDEGFFCLLGIQIQFFIRRASCGVVTVSWRVVFFKLGR